MAEDRRFPIQSPHIQSIPWAMIQFHGFRAVANHGQTLERLAERGGLSADEALFILDNLPWSGRVFILPRDRKERDAWDLEKSRELIERVRLWEAS